MSLVLALHSSSEVLGVGVASLDGQGACDGKPAVRSQAFPLGRSLSNQLFNAVEAVLPAEQW